MALPTTITGIGNTAAGGPYISSAGNVYIIARGSTTSLLRAFKATDPTSSFSNVGTDITAPNNSFNGVDGYQVGDVIHVVTMNGTDTGTAVADIRYHKFNMATDTWDTSNEVVVTDFLPATTSDINACAIVVRSNGDVIVSYNGAKVANMGTDRNRVYYARKISGVWTVDVIIDDGGATSWYNGDAVLGSSDRTHFFFVSGGVAAYQRTLNSANTLETFPAAFDSSISAGNNSAKKRGASYVSGANTKVRSPYDPGTSAQLNVAVLDSADAPTVTTVADITGTTNAVQGLYSCTLATDGTDLYVHFTGNTDSDAYFSKNSDDAGWSASGTLIRVETAWGLLVTANIYTRSGSKVLAIYSTDSGTATYDEYTLAAADTTPLRIRNQFDLPEFGEDPEIDDFNFVYNWQKSPQIFDVNAGAFSDTAIGTLTWEGKSTAADAFSMVPAGSVTWTGASTAADAFSMAAAGSVTWTGASTAAGGWSAAAVATLTWNGVSIVSGAWSAAAAGVLTWNGTSTAASAFSDTAAAVLTWNGASTATSAFNHAAIATLTWNGASTVTSDWSIATAAAVTWNGAGVASGAWSAAAVATLTWDGVAAQAGTAFNIAAAATVTWNGVSTSAADWSSAAAGVATWNPAPIAASNLFGLSATSTLDFQAVIFMNGAWNAATTAAVTWTGTSNASGAWAEAAVGNLTWNGAETAAAAFSDTAATVLTWDTKAFTSGAWSAAAVGLESWTGVTLTQTGSDLSIVASAAANFAGAATDSAAASIIAAAQLTFTGLAVGAAKKQNFDGWKPKPARIEEDEEKLLEELKKGALMFFQQGGANVYH